MLTSCCAVSGRLPAGCRQRLQSGLPLGPDTVPASGRHQVGVNASSAPRLLPHEFPAALNHVVCTVETASALSTCFRRVIGWCMTLARFPSYLRRKRRSDLGRCRPSPSDTYRSSAFAAGIATRARRCGSAGGPACSCGPGPGTRSPGSGATRGARLHGIFFPPVAVHAEPIVCVSIPPTSCTAHDCAVRTS